MVDSVSRSKAPIDPPSRAEGLPHELLGRMVVAIDGPSGAGKTTTARLVAQRLGLQHLDTGAMYRAVTWKALRLGIDPLDSQGLATVAADCEITFTDQEEGTQRVYLDGEDVSEVIRSTEVTGSVSPVSAHAPVRREMVRRQRALADAGGVVLEGRDIGSVVLPAAHVKIYLDASIEERARRRMLELNEKGIVKSVHEIQEDIRERDRKDSSRETSPLKIPIGASIIDTSDMSIEAQVSAVVGIVERRARELREARVPVGSRNPYRRQRMHYRLICAAVRLLAKSAWGTRVIRKSDLDLAENYIYAPNHRSGIDPPLVGSVIPGEVYYVAKHTLFRRHLIGRFLRWINAMPIRRTGFDRAAMERCLDLLANGKSVMIFPQGRRVAGGELGQAKAGVGYLALKSGVPVVPVYVQGTNHLWRAFFRRPRTTIVFGQPMRLTDPDLDRWDGPEQYREFGQMLMAGIEALQDGLPGRRAGA